MSSIARTITFVALCVLAAVIYSAFAQAIVDMAPTLAAAQTARVQAVEATRQVQAHEWGATMRVCWPAVAAAAAVIALAAAGAWTAVQWQRERSRRHGMSEQRRIILAYIAANGGRAGARAGTPGVYLDGSREFVPWQVAAAELLFFYFQLLYQILSFLNHSFLFHLLFEYFLVGL